MQTGAGGIRQCEVQHVGPARVHLFDRFGKAVAGKLPVSAIGEHPEKA